jgi:SAM-dependent methyltransferase
VENKTAEYGNWVSLRLVLVPGVLALLLGGSAVFLPPLGIAAGFFLLVSAYFAYARYAFSPRGRDIQAKVLDLVLSHVPEWDGEGKVLDIGCGSGALTIRIAKRYPNARVVGIDRWSGGWGSSKRLCERNASLEEVAERVSFEGADAASLPFDDDAFDLAVSNFVFHEVRGVRDKRRLLEEALRVVKAGGWFVFQDLFLWRLVYGEIDDLLDTVRSWGGESVEFVDTSESAFIPGALKLPFMLGTAGILRGKK